MSTTVQAKNQKLDAEWVNLMITAQKMGLTLEEIRSFLANSSENDSVLK